MSSRADSNTNTNTVDETMRFGPFKLASDQVFYKTTHSAAFVNLRPIVPGHVLVMPHRIVPLMSDLTEEEYIDLWITVRTAQKALKQYYTSCEAFNVAVQDGEAAGQSVPHVHVHILPRTAGDYERNDDIYQDIQDWAPKDTFRPKRSSKLDVPDDENRRDRSAEEMAAEALLYRNILNNEEK